MQDLSLDMFSAPMILTFMRQAFKIKAPHSFAILREIFPLKNEVITASVPKIIVSAAITAQEYKLRKKFTAILIVSLALKKTLFSHVPMRQPNVTYFIIPQSPL